MNEWFVVEARRTDVPNDWFLMSIPEESGCLNADDTNQFLALLRDKYSKTDLGEYEFRCRCIKRNGNTTPSEL